MAGGDCLLGCPIISPGSMETRPISTQGDCIWPADTDLCCAHVPLACKTAASKLYDDCKADPILGPAADAAKSALEALGCEPTLM